MLDLNNDAPPAAWARIAREQRARCGQDNDILRPRTLWRILLEFLL